MKPRIRVGTSWRLGHLKEDMAHWVCVMESPNRSLMGMGPTPEAAYWDWYERNKRHHTLSWSAPR